MARKSINLWKIGHGFRGKVWHENREISGKLGMVFEAKSGMEIEKFLEKISLIFSAENVNLIFLCKDK